MKCNRKILGSMAVAVVFASGVRVMARGEAELAKAPAAVQEAVKKALGDKGKLSGCETEPADGKTAYDVDLNIDGGKSAMLIAESGAVLEREVAVADSMVPPAVMDAAMKAHPDGKKAEFAIIAKGDHLYYEAEMNVGKEEHVINISSGGKILADTVSPPEAPEVPAPGGKAAKPAEEKD